MSVSTLKELYVDQLKDLYNAESQLVKALPKMAQAATSTQLRQTIEDHLTQTEGHVQRLTRILEVLDETAGSKVCKAMKGLIAEGEEAVGEIEKGDVLDAGIIAAAQRVEHYEIAGYGTARNFAKLLGDKEAVSILQQTLDEEGAADEKLTKLANATINKHAKKASASAEA